MRVLGAAREVGGSCVAVETDQCKVALDYGIKLDKPTDEYPKNFDAIIISHAHLDHTGSLVRLSKSRNKQRIVGSKVTRDITVDLLKDMVKIQNIKSADFGYDESAVTKVRDAWMHYESAALPGMTVELYPAGHVAGAKMVGVHSEGKTALYTGDFCLHNTQILKGCNVDALPQSPDVLISESTYGGKIRPPRTELIDQFLRQIASTMKDRGNILVPAFAFHRSQEVAKLIDNAIETGALPRYNSYMISNLAQKINGHFNANKQLFTEQIQQQDRPFEYKHVKFVERTTDIKEPAIAICTSGFGHAGASLNLLTQWAEVEENSVIITSGYLPPDSPLTLAKEKGHFRVNGEAFSVEAHFSQIELSGHADQQELTALVSRLKPKKTLLMHGDLDQAEALSKEISGLTEVCIPEKGEPLSI
ncbi:MAG: MBL fold metallo-hydrolase [Candidatus Bathyarchaeota archaeon]|nr:MBL fold metallo-hydrolase [Candidatus Bathyarchaeota archaeon]